jgi:hypothetical protein
MHRVSRRGKRDPRYNFIWDALARIRFEFSLAADLMARLDALPLPDDDGTRLAACNSLVSAIVLAVVGCLRPDLLAEVALPRNARYNDDLFEPVVRERVLCMLLDLIKFDAGAIHSWGEDEEQRLTLAVTLVEAAVAEIGQHVLDKPIIYAPTLTHTLNLVSAYLRELAARDFCDKTWVGASRDILYLIVWGISPHYLAAPAIGKRKGAR